MHMQPCTKRGVLCSRMCWIICMAISLLFLRTLSIVELSTACVGYFRTFSGIHLKGLSRAWQCVVGRDMMIIRQGCRDAGTEAGLGMGCVRTRAGFGAWFELDECMYVSGVPEAQGGLVHAPRAWTHYSYIKVTRSAQPSHIQIQRLASRAG